MYVLRVACQISRATTTVYTVAAMYVFTTRMNVIAMPVPSMYARGKLLMTAQPLEFNLYPGCFDPYILALQVSSPIVSWRKVLLPKMVRRRL